MMLLKVQLLLQQCMLQAQMLSIKAAGGTGTGVFTAAKEVNEKLSADSNKKVWVIGVDRDQSAEGNYTSSDKKNLTSF